MHSLNTIKSAAIVLPMLSCWYEPISVSHVSSSLLNLRHEEPGTSKVYLIKCNKVKDMDSLLCQPKAEVAK